MAKILEISDYYKITIFPPLSFAKDLIGLICHHYVQSRREPQLKNTTPAGYSLYMADDDGMVEEDFAPLDSRHVMFVRINGWQ